MKTLVKKILISSDSTSDLSHELIGKYGIKSIPLHVNMDGKSFCDGVDIFPEEIFKSVEKSGKLPTTSAISIGEFTDYFKELLKENKQIIHYSISSSFSGTYQNACIAAAEFKGVFVVDTKNLSTGEGLTVLKAAQMAKEDLEANEIIEKSLDFIERVDASFVIDTLSYLHKGGRCSAVAALGANLLRLKPCIEVKNGKMGVGKKYRGKQENIIIEYVKDRLSNINVDNERIFITHSGCSGEIIDSVKREIEQTKLFNEIIVTRAGSTISTHCGPNTLGIMFILK